MLERRHAPDLTRLAAEALQILLDLTAAQGVALVVEAAGQWKVESARGRGPDPDETLVAEAIDRDQVLQHDEWWVAPVRWGPGLAGLVLHAPQTANQELVRALTTVLAEAQAQWFAQRAVHLRARRLAAILEIVAEWQQTLETDQLLRRMAETSTQLLNSERASIFLWDQRNRTLVGRPALGVDGDELRIPDDKGVVGQVIQTGQPLRVNVDEDQKQIDRAVDKKLKFRTESLLCVPLVGASGELFGAFELINKRDGRFTDDDETALIELARHAAIALENTQNYEQLLRARNQLADQAAAGLSLIGEHPAIEALRSTIRRVADTDLAVLILGENGTGKEVVTQMIHYLSQRRGEPLVAVNCAAITETLLESELFGHEKGAFTDARESRPGKFELAAHGTLFLDEIGDLSPAGQAKLLRAIEEKVVVRVGGSRPIPTDARIVAATNRDLARLVAEKRFREDLFFRLNVVSLVLPPLRDRGDDCLLLAEHFLADFCRRANRKPPKFTPPARRRLREHRWPGNVRELRNLMERLAYLHPGDRIDAHDFSFIFPTESRAGGGETAWTEDQTLTEATRAFQTDFIERKIDAARGNISEAARQLGLHRANLYRKMQQLGMGTSEDEDKQGD